MKSSKALVWVLIGANVILIALCAFLYLRTDRSAPTIEFSENNTVYRSGMDEEKLLSGSYAYDKRDGEISDRIVIEKISEDKVNNRAVVFYAVSDLSGNVQRASREFEANYSESIFSAGSEEMGNIEKDSEDKAGEEKTENEDNNEKTADTEGDSGENESDGNGEDTEATPEPTIAPTETPAPTATPRPTNTPRPTEAKRQEEPSANDVQAEQQAQIPEEAPVNIPPTLTLKQTAIKTTVGVRPAWVQIIKQLTDDKDSYETLFNNISVSKYDINTPGTYQVTVTTKDSDGNQSAPQSLAIIVE